MITLKVPGDMDGLSAREFLGKYVYDMQEAEQLFRSGKVRRLPWFGKLEPMTPLKRGSKVALLTQAAPDAYRKAAEIVYEDEEFLVYNKPRGMTCIKRAEEGGNLYYQAVEHMQQQDEYDLRTLHVPYVCNVLSESLGGLVIIAKEQFLFEHMLRALRERRIKRVYRVIVTGEPQQSALLHGFMERGGAFSKAVLQEQMNRNARPAALRYRLIERRGELSLLEVEPMSYYKQQVPLQLASAGLPILGDRRYGNNAVNKKYGIDAAAIWAYKIIFETGRNNYMEYLNGREIQASTEYMPGIGYFMEREEQPRLRVEPLNRKQVKQAAKLAFESFVRSVAPDCTKQGVTTFREFVKPARLQEAAERKELELFGCFGAEGMLGMMALSAKSHISLLFVKESARGQGVGSALLEQAERICSLTAGALLTVRAAPGAVAFYERKGFCAQGEQEERDGIPFTAMEKKLEPYSGPVQEEQTPEAQEGRQGHEEEMKAAEQERQGEEMGKEDQ